MECTKADLGERILIAGGVAKSKLWKQIIADVTGYSVVCPIHDAEANLGDVMLAGIGTGILSYEDIKKWQILGDEVVPDMENHEKYSQYYSLYRSIYEHLKQDMEELSEIR